MAQLQVLVEPIFSTLPPGLESWLRLLLFQQVSRWKEKGRNAVGLRDEAVAARPPPPVCLPQRQRWTSSWSPDSAPRCQEGAPGGRLPSSWLELGVNPSPSGVQACERGREPPRAGNTAHAQKTGPVVFGASLWEELGRAVMAKGCGHSPGPVQPQPHFLGMKVPRAPSRSSLGMPCGPGCGGCG